MNTNRNHQEHAEKLTLLQSVQQIITDPRSAIDIDVVCGLIEQIAGESPTHGEFRGQMMELRHADRVHYVLMLKAIVDAHVDDLIERAAPREDVELYRQYAETAEEAYRAVRAATDAPQQVVTPASLATNTLNAESDAYRHRVHGTLA